MATAVSKEASFGQSNNGSNAPKDAFDPDDYRMTIGDHLEELRTRLFLALAGYAILLVVCFIYGKQTVSAFCGPLVKVLHAHKINPQLVVDEAGEGFMVVITITMVSAAALGAPWIAYQAWQFVAAGLYPHERKYVTRFLPLSITLLITGMLFVYYLILPWALEFLITFSTSVPISGVLPKSPVPQLVAQPGPFNVPVLNADPTQAAVGDMWYVRPTGQLKMFVGSDVRVLQLQSDNLLAPEIKLSGYIDMVIMMLVVFGLSFQLPLVVLLLERIGIVPVETLRSARRYVYLILAIVSAVITPGGDIVVMLGLTVPLIGLYELGIWLSQIGRKRRAAAA